jgi:hypothetical protein
MYEIIKEQFKSARSLTSSKYFTLVNRGNWPKFYWDLFPLAQEYYHELHPYFLFNYYTSDFFQFTKTITVRDGYVTFANFIMNNYASLDKLKAGPMFIHPDLAPIIPQSLYHRFATWEIVQKKQVSLAEAKNVIIFGFVCEENLGDLEGLVHRIKDLENIREDAEISLYLPLRKNIFEVHGKESTAIHTVMSALKDRLPKRKLKILLGEHFFEISNFRGTYLYDLAFDKFYVSDNYLHYYVQSRGATVNNGSLKEAPADSIFCLDLSIHHELHITPLKPGHSLFADLLFHKKRNPSVKDFHMDFSLHQLLREGLRKES